MSIKQLVAAAGVAIVAATAVAQEATPDTWINIEGTKSRAQVKEELAIARANGDLETIREYDVYDRSFRSTLSRAEVIADLQIWREAGLADLYRGEASPNYESPAYRQAYARYVAVRSSPQFALRVQDIARARGESVTVASPAPAQTAVR